MRTEKKNHRVFLDACRAGEQLVAPPRSSRRRAVAPGRLGRSGRRSHLEQVPARNPPLDTLFYVLKRTSPPLFSPEFDAHMFHPMSFWRRWIVGLSLGTWFSIACVAGFAEQTSSGDSPESLRVLLLGDQGPHQPARRASELMPVLEQRGIRVTYTENAEAALRSERLSEFDGLILYANIDRIEPAQADALLEYVEAGGGFIPLHSASYCFRNDPRIVALMGGQFQRHETGVFSVQATEEGQSHPLMQGYQSFESWDETYVHTAHNPVNRTVLEVRMEQEQREPWTWVRTQGEGRVFYTAWGHDQRTFTHPGFHNLVERGIRWACGGDPSVVPEFRRRDPDPFADVSMTPRRTDVEPFEYVEVGPKIPNYVRGEKWGEQAQPRGRMQKPLSPQESIKHFVVPQDFEVELFASEPDLGGKPICMSWDHRGRLWVAETVDYPNEQQPEGMGRDRIRICEDTNGDGRADRFTLFAENLSIPTSIAFSHDGVIVHQPPHTLFLQDTNGDDRADVRKVLFTGWKTDDTHAGPSNLQDGFDGWFYGVVGYAGFEGEIAGRSESFRTGFYRFQVERVAGEVEVTDFEFLRNTNNNTWGLGLSEEGLLFGSTANRNPSEFMPVPNRFYERVRGWTSTRLEGIADTHQFHPITDDVRQVDHHGGYTAAAGHALYTARNYPPEYWNRTAFVAGPTGHLVGTFVLERDDGSAFRSTSPLNLLASDDEWSAPTMAEVGPDGNVWVIDWYNYIVQHNPTPVGFETGPGNAYETDLRDKKHARIYRIRYTGDRGGPTPETDSLAEASPNELVAALQDPNLFWRRHAQRLLVESMAAGTGSESPPPRSLSSVNAGTKEPINQLAALIRQPQLDKSGLDVAAIHALRTLDGLGLLEGKEAMSLLANGLRHRSAGVVRTAVAVLPPTEAGRERLLESGALSHEDAQVRLASLLAIAEMPPSGPAGRAVIDALHDPRHANDRWIIDASTSAAATNAVEVLVGLSKRSADEEPPLRVASTVAEHVARSADGSGARRVLVALAQADPGLAAAVVEGLTKGWPADESIRLDPATDEALVALLQRLPSATRGRLVRLAQLWGSDRLAEHADQIAGSLLATVDDRDASDEIRIEAAEQLVDLAREDLQTTESLLELVTPQTAPAVATGILEAFRRSRADGLGELVLSKLDSLTPQVRPAAIRTLTARGETTRTLLEAMESGRVGRQELPLDQQQSLLAHPDREIRQLAEQVMSQEGGLPSPDRAKVLQAFLPVTERAGSVERGREIYKKHCANCHRHQREGKEVGPDLTGMAVHPKEELLTQILDPSSSVEGNYQSYSVLTTDGIVLSGMLASETQTSIELIDSQAKQHLILREEIEELVASNKSVMPEGFEKQIDEQGFADLLEFLTAKGRYVPLPIGKVATAVSTKGLFHEGDDGPDRMIFDDWSMKESGGVPFQLVDPRGDRIRNLILLRGPQGSLPPKMPASVRIPCNTEADAIHLLSGVSGWGHPASGGESVSMIVRLHYADGETEDHRLKNGVHFADYIRRVDVPESAFAFALGNQQIRRLAVHPQREEPIAAIELVKGEDRTAPMVMAVTVERADSGEGTR